MTTKNLNLNDQASSRAGATVRSPYLLVGSGRLAKHLYYYFQKLNIPVQTWHRQQEYSELQEALGRASRVLLAIKDAAIVEFFEKHLESQARAHSLSVVHFSGSVYDSRMTSLHPLCSFSHELFDETFYSSIAFAVTPQVREGHPGGSESSNGHSLLKSYLPELTNPSFYLPKEQKALYHALCVVGGNGTTVLWAAMAEQFQKLGISEQMAMPYLNSLLFNFSELGSAALTGPWIRNDQATILKNKDALAAIDSQTNLKQTYEALEALATTLIPKESK